MLQRASLIKPGMRTDLTYTKEAKLKDTIHINEEETGDAKKKDAAVNSLQNMAAIIAFIIMTGFLDHVVWRFIWEQDGLRSIPSFVFS